MTASSPDSVSRTETETFEHSLTLLVREAFAQGADIEGTWEVASRSDLVPNWRIVIEKTSTADLPSDGSTFVDE